MVKFGTVAPNHNPLETGAELFFNSPDQRPDSPTVANAIESGLVEDDLHAAAKASGLEHPKMELALADLVTALPYYHRLSDQLHKDHNSDMVLFAGRDAEALYDDYSVAYRDEGGLLLPASSNLWDAVATTERDVVADFLADYGLGGEGVANKDSRYVLVDTGFAGTVADRLNQVVRDLHGVDLMKTGRLAVKLVCSYTDRPEIVSFSMDEDPETELVRPAQARAAGYSGLNFDLATNMQMTPRYHGPYAEFVLDTNGVVAKPKSEDKTVTLNVDGSTYANDSIVNSYAAAVFQFRTVKAGLGRNTS